MQQSIILIVIFMAVVQGSTHTDNRMDDVRSHLTKANQIFCESSQFEIQKWGKWFRTITRQDKQNVKQWLKDKIDHC